MCLRFNGHIRGLMRERSCPCLTAVKHNSAGTPYLPEAAMNRGPLANATHINIIPPTSQENFRKPARNENFAHFHA